MSNPDIVLRSEDTLVFAISPPVKFLPGTAIVKNSPSGPLNYTVKGSEIHIELKGSGLWKSEKKVICHQKDIETITVSANYSTDIHTIIGAMKISLSALPNTSQSSLVKLEDKDAIALKGQPYDLLVTTSLKATSASDGSPDPNTYKGTAQVQLADPNFFIKFA